MAAAVPVETAVEDRVQRRRRGGVGRSVEHMVELVRVFLPDVTERDARKAARQRRIEAHGNASPYSIAVHATHSASAVGTAARITP